MTVINMNNADAVKLGSTDADKVYLGSSPVWLPQSPGGNFDPVSIVGASKVCMWWDTTLPIGSVFFQGADDQSAPVAASGDTANFAKFKDGFGNPVTMSTASALVRNLPPQIRQDTNGNWYIYHEPPYFTSGSTSLQMDGAMPNAADDEFFLTVTQLTMDDVQGALMITDTTGTQVIWQSGSTGNPCFNTGGSIFFGNYNELVPKQRGGIYTEMSDLNPKLVGINRCGFSYFDLRLGDRPSQNSTYGMSGRTYGLCVCTGLTPAEEAALMNHAMSTYMVPYAAVP